MTARLPRTMLVGVMLCTWVLVAGICRLAEPSALIPVFIGVGVVSTLLAAFDRGVWRWPVVRAFVRRPDVEGTWIGEIHSEWRDPRTGEQVPPIPAALVVRQTYCDIVVSQFTAASSSVTISAAMTEDSDGRWLVVGLYRNEPRLPHQDFSRIHHGGLRMHLAVGAPQRLQGVYWTDRGNRGELEFRFVTATRAHDFTAAQELAAKHGMVSLATAHPLTTPAPVRRELDDQIPALREELSRLLQSVFDEHELRKFATHSGAGLAGRLPGGSAPLLVIADEFAGLLVRENRVGEALERLREQRPKWSAKIEELMSRVKETPPSTLPPGPAPTQ